jgi:hypothetical protein
MLRGYVWVVFVQGWRISCGSKFSQSTELVFFFEGSYLEALRRVLIERKGFNSERQGWRGWNQRRWSTAMKDLGESKAILNLGNGWHVINSLTCVDICNLFSTSVDGLWLLRSGLNIHCLYLKQLEVMELFHSASIYGVVQVVLCSFCFLCCSHSEFHSIVCLWGLLGIVCLRGILTSKLCESWSEYDYLK